MKKLLALITVMAVMSSVLVFANEAPALSQKTDRFKTSEEWGGKLISDDGQLIIHVGDETPIFLEDGTQVSFKQAKEDGEMTFETIEEFLNNRKLIVEYSVVTFSIPPQTAPTKITVLFEEAVAPSFEIEAPAAPALEADTEGVSDFYANLLNGDVVVNNKIIDAPVPYIRHGVVMVPLRAVVEALGFDVSWDGETESIRLGTAINLWVGKDEYIRGRMAPITLGVAPEVLDLRTFVPMSFFREVLGDYTAYVLEGQVVVVHAATNDMF